MMKETITCDGECGGKLNAGNYSAMKKGWAVFVPKRKYKDRHYCPNCIASGRAPEGAVSGKYFNENDR